jgi:fatty-acyl-CoA synthase
LAEVAVIGIPDEKWGEAPVAHIVLEPGAGTGPEAFVEYCLERIAKYKVPKHFRFVEELPRTATGKVNKPELKQKALEHILIV